MDTALDEVTLSMIFYRESWQMEYEYGVEQQIIIESYRKIIAEQGRIIEKQGRALAELEGRQSIMVRDGPANDE